MTCWIKALCVAYSALTPQALPASVSGQATVQDGDTIYVEHQPVRLQGVDAAELTERGGVAAKYALKAIIGSSNVTCELSGRSYARAVGVCHVGNVELNRAIIQAGYALDCARYSGGKYRADEPPGARGRLIQKPYC